MESMRVHTLTIKRDAQDSQDAVGGHAENYTIAGRGHRPAEVRGRAIVLSAKEKLDYGIRGEKIGWKFLIPGDDPEITQKDQITFEYASGDTRTVRVLVGSYARSADTAFWKVVGDEDSTRT